MEVKSERVLYNLCIKFDPVIFVACVANMCTVNGAELPTVFVIGAWVVQLFLSLVLELCSCFCRWCLGCPAVFFIGAWVVQLFLSLVLGLSSCFCHWCLGCPAVFVIGAWVAQPFLSSVLDTCMAIYFLACWSREHH